MRNIKLFLMSVSFFAMLFFACKGTGKTGQGAQEADKNKNNPTPTPQVQDGDKTKFDIEKVVLGYTNIGEGASLERKDLNSSVVLQDMEVSGAKFPIIIKHKNKFTIEKIDITINGSPITENPEMSKYLMKWEVNLAKNTKTAFKITIKADPQVPNASLYETINISFNVTYKDLEIKKLIGTRIGITHNSKKTNTTWYEMTALAISPDVHRELSLLESGKEVVAVANDKPKLTITLAKSTEQAKAIIKLNDTDLNLDFEEGKTKLEATLPTLTKGDGNVLSITLTKKDKAGKVQYEKKNYSLKLNYKPLLSLKSLTVNGKTYQAPVPDEMVVSHDDVDPITLAAEGDVAGAIASFKKEGPNDAQGKPTWIDLVSSSISLAKGNAVKIRCYLALDGYTSVWRAFTLKRKKENKVAVTYSVEGGIGGALTAKVQGESETFTSGKNVDVGKDVVFTATSESGYVLDKWIVDGKDITWATLEYIHKIEKACEVKVKFKSLKLQIESVTIAQKPCQKDSVVDVAKNEVELVVVIKDEEGHSYSGTDLKAYANDVAETHSLGDAHYCSVSGLQEGENPIKVEAKLGTSVKDTFNFKVKYTKPSISIDEIKADDKKASLQAGQTDKYTVELGDSATQFAKLEVKITPESSQEISKFKLEVLKGTEVYVANGLFASSGAQAVCSITKPDSKTAFDLHHDMDNEQWLEFYTLKLYYDNILKKTLTLKANGKYD